ncbi:hypothetical protein A3F65_02745 [Candidatus Saccharibacteria bacterium RIFCSPHIGHO2_12_FULL_47_16b]|nr:MAG: hypothetical protein A3F65_02745 [Candidatus Saccharibacteria bacterium RIFCSPHIGHO2_12_FULL_47_16b]OGL38997.1 MAG: hypothetical protein A3J32_01210 [Candidatus Saccharibacteria bacterium RIFCSPLOWO2_02_FULL_46_7]
MENPTTSKRTIRERFGNFMEANLLSLYALAEFLQVRRERAKILMQMHPGLSKKQAKRMAVEDWVNKFSP